MIRRMARAGGRWARGAVVLGVIVAAAPVDVRGPASVAASAAQTRCGWYSNPSPANHYLFDRDGRWVIGEQGGPPARGFGAHVRAQNTSPSHWVGQNVGSYGYGCLCVEAEVDADEMRILRILSSRQRPLAACRTDRRIPAFEAPATR